MFYFIFLPRKKYGMANPLPIKAAEVETGVNYYQNCPPTPERSWVITELYGVGSCFKVFLGLKKTSV